MKNRFLSVVLFLSLISLKVEAQQALWGEDVITSPEINTDQTVTFRYLAPDAKEVKISGDWFPSKDWVPGSEMMNKNEKGIWS